MTGIAGRTEVLVTADLGMMTIGICFVVLVAIDAFKHRVVGSAHVAVRTLVPDSAVLAGIDREILRIMIPGGGLPG